MAYGRLLSTMSNEPGRLMTLRNPLEWALPFIPIIIWPHVGMYLQTLEGIA